MISGRRYTEEDLAAVSDNPEWTAEDFAAAKPFDVVFPDLAAAIDRSEMEPKARQAAVQVFINRDLVDMFKAKGPDWEARLNQKLREALDVSADVARSGQASFCYELHQRAYSPCSVSVRILDISTISKFQTSWG